MAWDGRPTILNEELIKQFCELEEEGLPIKYCCDYLYVEEVDFYRWMKKGEEAIEKGIDERNSIYARFCKEIKQHRSIFVKESGKKIRSLDYAGKWSGLAWWLERTNKDFMPKQEIKAGDDGKVTVILGGKVKSAKNANGEEMQTGDKIK